jgi:hypothetical protein
VELPCIASSHDPNFIFINHLPVHDYRSQIWVQNAVLDIVAFLFATLASASRFLTFSFCDLSRVVRIIFFIFFSLMFAKFAAGLISVIFTAAPPDVATPL